MDVTTTSSGSGTNCEIGEVVEYYGHNGKPDCWELGSLIRIREEDFNRLKGIFEESKSKQLAMLGGQGIEIFISLARKETEGKSIVGAEITVTSRPSVPGSVLNAVSALHSTTYSLTSNIRK